MLGESVSDDEGADGGISGAVTGMCLLPVKTVFAAEKHRTRVTAVALEVGGVLAALSGAALEGYEIHMGVTENADAPLLRLSDGSTDGCQFGNVYGTYLHGFFDSAQCRDRVLGALCKRKGVSLDIETFDFTAYKERNYDLLAQGVRDALDMRLIYRILEEGA
jgi:adenosylcobyric acid synthase